MNRKLHKQIWIFSIFIILVAQFNLEVFSSSFRVSLGILLLPLLVFFYGKIPILPIAALAGVGVFLSRILIQTLRYGFDPRSLAAESPETIAYYAYGVLCWLYFRKTDYNIPRKHCYPVLFFLDYLANLAELICRQQLGPITSNLHLDIILVALLRSIVLWAVITGLSQYRFLLISTEHSRRYQQLILLISKLNSEIIWMNKNAVMLETTMAKSYQLFSRLQEQHADPVLTQNALTVAKDIHEVKKEYHMILRGITEALELNLCDGDMTLSDLLRVLQNSLTLLAEENGKKLEFSIHMDTNFKTDKYFFLLSVFRNLFTNAMEANMDGTILLSFVQVQEGDDYVFSVSDNGPGISPEYLGQIFMPGFSTKINFDTGEVSRGLGLNLVEDIVKNQLHGSICVHSKPGCTTFCITVPKEQLEVLQS